MNSIFRIIYIVLAIYFCILLATTENTTLANESIPSNPTSSRTVISNILDPQGDAPSSIDITAQNVSISGRGVIIKTGFRESIPANFCINFSSTSTACLKNNKLYQSGKVLPAKISITQGRFLRIWIRASHINILPGRTLTVNSRTQLLVCEVEICSDSIANIRTVFQYPKTCASPSGKFLNGARRGEKLVALTFDDGPHDATPGLLDLLKREKVPATFYMNGIHLGTYPALTKRMKNEGHELANHSWAHELYPSRSSMSRTSSKIQQQTGYTPCTFRPPYGGVNSRVIQDAGSLGMATIIWDIDPRDWETNNVSTIIQRASAGNTGSIVLMHDGGGGNYSTVAAVPQVIQNYRARGFSFVTVDELLNWQKR